MSIWKDFARAVESKMVRKHFGDVASIVNASAIFEFTLEQLTNASAYRPPPSDDPIPPFPFPRLCCVGPGGVVLLQAPTMGDGDLAYESIVWMPSGSFITGKCSAQAVDSALAFSVSDIRCITGGASPVYSDETNTLRDQRQREREDQDSELLRTIAKARRLAESEDAAVAENATAMVQELTALHERVVNANRVLTEREKDLEDAARELMLEAFEQGLRNVIWINKPDHYTVQAGVGNKPRKAKGKDPRVLRRDERPHYIVMTKHEIAETWRRVHHGGTHASPVPHLRRGHYRRLQPGPTRPDGRVVWVRATHVNGECVEWRDGNTVYRVV